ncbi:hypothetical protein [Ekhidna sp. To15]|uniref:hypothetical protein n=1 Tax=Ekhidna sp. To15 TaxID=3395267 RepID=UPI003F520DC7
MQIKNNHPKNLHKSWIIALIKLALLSGCLYFIYHKLQSQSTSINEIPIPNGFWLTLFTVTLLMIVNWHLEAFRWKLSIEQFEQISILEAWKVILAGLALNWILPFTTGDLLARISHQKDKFQTTSAAVLNRGIMLSFTLIIGLYGTSFLAQNYEWNGWFVFSLLISIPLLKLLLKDFINRFMKYFKGLSRELLMRVVTISLLRYTVFVLQFYLLLTTFLPLIEPQILIGGIGWIFLVRSALPLFFGGIGVREASGLFFFEPYVAQLELVIAPVFLIWIINIVMPSLVGLLFVIRSKPSFAS